MHSFSGLAYQIYFDYYIRAFSRADEHSTKCYSPNKESIKFFFNKIPYFDKKSNLFTI